MNETPDLTNEFHPVPKVFKAKKEKKGLNPIGKKGANWNDARAQLIILFEKNGITECEIKYKGCWKDNALGFAHVDKRRFLSQEDVRSPNKVVLACNPCHQIVEQESREEMRKELDKIIAAREWR